MKIKNWLIEKLGGHVLTHEEKMLLMPLWMKRVSGIMNKRIDKDAAAMLYNSFSTEDWVPGKITPIYVKWLWLDRILCKIFNPFKKL